MRIKNIFATTLIVLTSIRVFAMEEITFENAIPPELNASVSELQVQVDELVGDAENSILILQSLVDERSKLITALKAHKGHPWFVKLLPTITGVCRAYEKNIFDLGMAYLSAGQFAEIDALYETVKVFENAPPSSIQKALRIAAVGSLLSEQDEGKIQKYQNALVYTYTPANQFISCLIDTAVFGSVEDFEDTIRGVRNEVSLLDDQAQERFKQETDPFAALIYDAYPLVRFHMDALDGKPAQLSSLVLSFMNNDPKYREHWVTSLKLRANGSMENTCLLHFLYKWMGKDKTAKSLNRYISAFRKENFQDVSDYLATLQKATKEDIEPFLRRAQIQESVVAVEEGKESVEEEIELVEKKPKPSLKTKPKGIKTIKPVIVEVPKIKSKKIKIVQAEAVVVKKTPSTPEEQRLRHQLALQSDRIKALEGAAAKRNRMIAMLRLQQKSKEQEHSLLLFQKEKELKKLKALLEDVEEKIGEMEEAKEHAQARSHEKWTKELSEKRNLRSSLTEARLNLQQTQAEIAQLQHAAWEAFEEGKASMIGTVQQAFIDGQEFSYYRNSRTIEGRIDGAGVMTSWGEWYPLEERNGQLGFSIDGAWCRLES